MPRFYERVGGGNGYVKGRVDGAFCTWQSTAGGTRKLLERGYSDGDEIDSWLFQHLIDCGDLYTGNSGLTERTRSGHRSQASSSTSRRRKSQAQAEAEESTGCVTVVVVIVFIFILFSC